MVMAVNGSAITAPVGKCGCYWLAIRKWATLLAGIAVAERRDGIAGNGAGGAAARQRYIVNTYAYGGMAFNDAVVVMPYYAHWVIWYCLLRYAGARVAEASRAVTVRSCRRLRRIRQSAFLLATLRHIGVAWSYSMAPA